MWQVQDASKLSIISRGMCCGTNNQHSRTTQQMEWTHTPCTPLSRTTQTPACPAPATCRSTGITYIGAFAAEPHCAAAAATFADTKSFEFQGSRLCSRPSKGSLIHFQQQAACLCLFTWPCGGQQLQGWRWAQPRSGQCTCTATTPQQRGQALASLIPCEHA